MPTVQVPVESLQRSWSPRLDGENPDHVQALAEVEGELPPIVVHRPTMRIIDGMHRLRAAQLRGQRYITACFFDGSEADAFLLAVRCNIRHGLPLSLTDRKAAARRIINLHPQLSDRLIAKQTGLSAKTVAEMRRHSRVQGLPDTRVGLDGRVRSVSSAEGRLRASELLTANPNLSLRQVARAAGISPETVRDVRGRLSRNESPVPQTPSGERKGAQDDGTREPEDPAGTPAPAKANMPAPELLAMIQQLEADPVLRANEMGRALLNILHANAAINRRFGTILHDVPKQCRDLMATAAMKCADTWQSLAISMASGDASVTTTYSR